MLRFHHDTTVIIVFALPCHPEAEPERENIEVNVRLHLCGHLGHQERVHGPAEHCHAAEPAEVELERFEIEDGQDLTGNSIWRRPYKLSDAIIRAAVERWAEEHEAELIEVMGQHVQDEEDAAAELADDLAEDRRFLASL